MVRETDEDRIRRKAHELWEAEGRPHGRDQDHWIQAREIIAIEDSEGDTLLPRDFGAEEPIEEPEEALRNLADFPNLTDQGENLLTSTDREPSFAGQEGMLSIEVPASDQPGIAGGSQKSKSAAAPKRTAKTSPAKPAQPVSMPTPQEGVPKAASVAKVARSGAVKSGVVSKKPPAPSPKKNG